jgi:apolipoprotein N-acyltransferase
VKAKKKKLTALVLGIVFLSTMLAAVSSILFPLPHSRYTILSGLALTALVFARFCYRTVRFLRQRSRGTGIVGLIREYRDYSRKRNRRELHEEVSAWRRRDRSRQEKV